MFWRNVENITVLMIYFSSQSHTSNFFCKLCLNKQLRGGQNKICSKQSSFHRTETLFFPDTQIAQITCIKDENSSHCSLSMSDGENIRQVGNFRHISGGAQSSLNRRRQLPSRGIWTMGRHEFDFCKPGALCLYFRG